MKALRKLVSCHSLLCKTRPRRSLSRGELVVFGFVLLAFSEGLKVFVHPRVPWIGFGFAMALGVLARVRLHLRLSENQVWLPATMVLVFSVVVASVLGGHPFYGFAQGAKIAVVVGIAWITLFSEFQYARVAFKALLSALVLNIILLLVGFMGAKSLAWEMAPGRWGTVLNPPGSLGRLGVAAWLYCGYSALIARRWWGWILLLVCWALVFLDGARAQFIFATLAAMGLVGLVWWETGRKRVLRTVVAVLLLVGATTSFLMGPRPEIAGAREAGGAGLLSVLFDPVRSEALRAGLRAVREHPFWGTGLGSTRVETPTGTIVIHNAYLQAWADIGLAGFLAYLWLMVAWLFWLPRAWTGARLMENWKDRALVYSALSALVAAVLGGLFVPMSTEWAEWVLFLLPLSIFWQAVRFGASRRIAGG